MAGKPIRSVEDFIAHYGVKGMKWGVINEDESSGEKGPKKQASSTQDKKTEALKEEYKTSISRIPNPSPKQVGENLARNKQKSLAKFDPKGETPANDPKRWKPTKKQVALVAAGAGVAGFLFYANHKGLFSPPVPGESVSASKFRQAVAKSKHETWGGKGFLTEKSLEREGFTLPAGHVFNRISTTAETGPSIWKGGTYLTHNTEDFNRYVAGFRNELGTDKIYHVKIEAAEAIRVPSTVEALESMRTALGKNGKKASFDEAVRQYNSMSGGSWTSEVAERFFADLSSKGFSAIVDEMDAGVIGETPLVLFNQKGIKNYAAELMSSEQIKTAEQSVVELLNRKP